MLKVVGITVPRLAVSLSTILSDPAIIGSLKVTVIVVLIGMPAALFTGIVLMTTGAIGVVPVMNLVVYAAANGTPVVLVTLPECRITVYCVPFASATFGFIVKILPLMLKVVGITVPGLAVSLRTISLTLPCMIGSLKVTVIVGVVDTPVALFTGLMLITFNTVVVVVKS